MKKEKKRVSAQLQAKGFMRFTGVNAILQDNIVNVKIISASIQKPEWRR